jgi:hypothetical protein
VLTDPDHGEVECSIDGTVRAGNSVLDPRHWTIPGELVRLPEGITVTLPSQEN